MGFQSEGYSCNKAKNSRVVLGFQKWSIASVILSFSGFQKSTSGSYYKLVNSPTFGEF